MKKSLVVETDYTTCWTNYPGGVAIVTGLRCIKAPGQGDLVRSMQQALNLSLWSPQLSV